MAHTPYRGLCSWCLDKAACSQCTHLPTINTCITTVDWLLSSTVAELAVWSHCGKLLAPPSNTWCWFLNRVCTPPHSFLSCSRVALSNSPTTSSRGKLPVDDQETQPQPQPPGGLRTGPPAQPTPLCSQCTHLHTAMDHLPASPSSPHPAEVGPGGGPPPLWQQCGPSEVGPPGCSSVRECWTWASA